MTSNNPDAAASKDEVEIHALIERWSKAVREEDMAGIRAHHDPGILMFDVPLPLQSRGLEDYMKTWDLFFPMQERPVVFDFHDIQVTAGQDVAFATALGKCAYFDPTGERVPLDFRLTMGSAQNRRSVAHHARAPLSPCRVNRHTASPADS